MKQQTEQTLEWLFSCLMFSPIDFYLQWLADMSCRNPSMNLFIKNERFQFRNCCHGCKHWKVKLFPRWEAFKVTVAVILEYSYNYADLSFCCITGQWLKVVGFIKNDSSTQIKPKYCLYIKHNFFIGLRRRIVKKKQLH